MNKICIVITSKNLFRIFFEFCCGFQSKEKYFFNIEVMKINLQNFEMTKFRIQCFVYLTSMPPFKSAVTYMSSRLTAQLLIAQSCYIEKQDL